MKVRVKAIARGFDGATIREPGDEFDLELGKDGKLEPDGWVQEVKTAQEGKSKKGAAAADDDKLA